MEKIGEVIAIPKKLEIEWKIERFPILLDDDNFDDDDEIYLESPLFYFAGINWYLEIYPNGSSEYNSNGYIDIYLLRESSGSPITLDYSLSLKTVNGKILPRKCYTNTFEEEELSYGVRCCISRSDLLHKKSHLMPSDVLTVVCSVDWCDPDTKMGDFYENIEGLMDRGDYSDTTIQVKGKEFKLHKNILAARNPFFDSMFKNNMKEIVTGIVSINDCEPEVFKSFIQFLYIGHVDDMSLENVCDLYEVADKYQQDQLKEECLQFMLNSLSIDNFCDFVVVALRHGEKELLDDAVKFFTSKLNEIIFSVKWATFLSEYPTYATEFRLKLIEYDKNSA